MNIKSGDISENLEMLLEIVGKEKFLEIARMYGGSNVYIPTYSSAIKSARNREIIKKYNGFNVNNLAREYNMSVTHIKRILKEDITIAQSIKQS